MELLEHNFVILLLKISLSLKLIRPNMAGLDFDESIDFQTKKNVLEMHKEWDFSALSVKKVEHFQEKLQECFDKEQ